MLYCDRGEDRKGKSEGKPPQSAGYQFALPQILSLYKPLVEIILPPDGR